MDKVRARRFWKSDKAAVAATYALALTGLVAIGGIAFDYSRMVTLDSELQAAADQAALAAATQLDGKSDAITRATAQASNLVSNNTYMSNDGDSDGRLVTIASVVFFASKADAEAGTPTTNVAANARFVRVTVDGRQVFYAFTPIVGAIASPDLTGIATAGMGSAICKVPPLMMCNPNEATDPTFTAANYIGKGIKLVSVGNGGGSWAPGNFGYLDTGSADPNKNIELRIALGWEAPAGDCLPQSGVSTSTGSGSPVVNALNTRFDIYANEGPDNACVTGGSCRPSINASKDVVRVDGDGCGIHVNQEWHFPTVQYLPDPITRLPVGTPTGMGHPRDICHAVSSAGDCLPNEKIGDGNWDRATYFSVNYPGLNWATEMTNTYGTTSVTRFQVYKWEIANRTIQPAGMTTTVGAPRIAYSEGKGKNLKDHKDNMGPVCAGSAIDPTTSIDRRTFPVAIINCTAESVGGNSDNVPVLKWMNVFLVEPSLDRPRTHKQEVYVEPVSVNTLGNSDGGVATLVRRDKPYLLN